MDGGFGDVGFDSGFDGFGGEDSGFDSFTPGVIGTVLPGSVPAVPSGYQFDAEGNVVVDPNTATFSQLSDHPIQKGINAFVGLVESQMPVPLGINTMLGYSTATAATATANLGGVDAGPGFGGGPGEKLYLLDGNVVKSGDINWADGPQVSEYKPVWGSLLNTALKGAVNLGSAYLAGRSTPSGSPSASTPAGQSSSQQISVAPQTTINLDPPEIDIQFDLGGIGEAIESAAVMESESKASDAAIALLGLGLQAKQLEASNAALTVGAADSAKSDDNDKLIKFALIAGAALVFFRGS